MDFFIVIFITGLRGIDFGYHWDEPKLIHQVSNSMHTGLFLPRSYIYLSMYYDLTILVATVDATKVFLKEGKFQLGKIGETVKQHFYLIKLRSFF